MKQKIKLLTILIILTSCTSTDNKTDNSTKMVDYGKIIEEYLQTKIIEPTVEFNNDGRKEIYLLEHKITWRALEKGIKITIDGHTITTSDKVTSNAVWGSRVDSVNFANFLHQVKIYEYDSLIGFEFELYNFNSDDRLDYLSKTFYGNNAQDIDTTEFVLYSQTPNGNFEEFKADKQKRFWFKHIYTEFQTDLKNEAFEEKWVEKINKNGK